MDGCPMSVVAAPAVGRRQRPLGLLQEIETHRPSAEFRRFGPEPPGYGQAECFSIERDGATEIRDVDVDEQLHTSSVAPLRRRGGRTCASGREETMPATRYGIGDAPKRREDVRFLTG